MALYFKILCPEKKIYEGEIESLQASASDGKFGILNNHAPMVSSLVAGDLIIKNNNNQEIVFETSDGILQVEDNKITVLVADAKEKSKA